MSSDIKNLLSFIAGATAALLGFAALILYAIGNVTDSSGAKGQGAMITCAIGAIAAAGAAVFIRTQNFNYS